MSANLATPRIRAPRSARAGEVVEIRTLMEHPMETGLRQEGGRSVPRDMLTRMAENQTLVVLARMNDGSVQRATAEIRVATGGCLT